MELDRTSKQTTAIALDASKLALVLIVNPLFINSIVIPKTFN